MSIFSPLLHIMATLLERLSISRERSDLGGLGREVAAENGVYHGYNVGFSSLTSTLRRSDTGTLFFSFLSSDRIRGYAANPIWKKVRRMLGGGSYRKRRRRRRRQKSEDSAAAK
mmetsp:Transcript_23022/g.67930  ORF Transcript_23022/g.67930 Transcript_23022/m.67930 type:complete len:114 (+) Transcript_23022:196-537(+)